MEGHGFGWCYRQLQCRGGVVLGEVVYTASPCHVAVCIPPPFQLLGQLLDGALTLSSASSLGLGRTVLRGVFPEQTAT